MRVAPDWNASPVPGHARLATASRFGFCASGSRSATLMTSRAPGRSKSTIKVEHWPVMMDSRACRSESQLVNSIPRCSSVPWIVFSERSSWHNTAADLRMNNKIRPEAVTVNVTAVIVFGVTKALCKWLDIIVLRAESPPLRVPPMGLPALPVAIIKNYAHVHETTDSLDDSFVRAPQWNGGARRRWPGHPRRIGDQALRQEDPSLVQRQNCGRICRLHSRRFHPLQPLRSEAGAVPRQFGPGRSRTRQRLANGQVSASPRSASAGQRQGADLPAKRTGRRHRARYRHCRDRQRWSLRPSRRASFGGAHATLRPSNCRRGNEDCGQDLHLHQ